MNAAHFDGTVKCSILSFTCFINHAIAVASYFVNVYTVYNVQLNDHHPNQKFVKTLSFMLFEWQWWYDVVMKCYVHISNNFSIKRKFSRQRNSNICSLFKSINNTMYRKWYCFSAKNTHWTHCKGADFFLSLFHRFCIWAEIILKLKIENRKCTIKCMLNGKSWA